MATRVPQSADTPPSFRVPRSPSFLTLDEFCWELRLSRSLALKILRSGEMPVVRIGKAHQYRIPRKAFESWQERKTATPADLPRVEQEESPVAGPSERGEEDGTTDKEYSAYACSIPT